MIGEGLRGPREYTPNAFSEGQPGRQPPIDKVVPSSPGSSDVPSAGARESARESRQQPPRGLTTGEKAALLSQEYAKHGGRELFSDVEIGPDGKPRFSVSLICGTPEGTAAMREEILWYLRYDPKRK